MKTRIRHILIGILLLAVTVSALPTGASTVYAGKSSSKKAVKSVKLSISGTNCKKKTYTVEKGQKVQLDVTVTPSKAKKSVKYSSGKKSVATVTKKGVIKAKKKGTAKITVKVKGKNGKTKTTWVKIKVVNPQPVVQQTAAPSANPAAVSALLSCADYYCSALDQAVKNGETWVYSNKSKYVYQKGSFDDMRNKKGGALYCGGNCASITNWALRDMGIIPKTGSIYGDSSGKIHNYNNGTSLAGNLSACFTVVETGGKKFQTLMDEGMIEAGDIVFGKNHTFIYRGDNIVYASGHDAKYHKDSSITTDDSKRAVFESWKRDYRETFDKNYKIYYIMRFKSDYVPTQYRNSSGKIVK